MLSRKGLVNFALASAITLTGLAGCVSADTKTGQYITGQVTQEYGNVARVMESSHTVLDYEVLKLGNPHYVIEVETGQGDYTIELCASDRCGGDGEHTVYNLAAAIEKGTRIRFLTRTCGLSCKEHFSSDRLGILDPDDIELLD